MTIEELLGLPKEGLEGLLKLSEEECAKCLEAITVIEPVPTFNAQIVGREEKEEKISDDYKLKNDKEIDDLVGETSDDNPISKLRRKKSQRGRPKKSSQSLFDEIDKLLEAELGTT